MITIPGCKGCDGLRRDKDGSIWLTRSNPQVERYLDRVMLRTRPGELRWHEIPKGERVVLQADQFINAHDGQIGLMLGKGPSLDRFITEYQKAKWHVVPIGINEAVLKFPCKYAFALDDTPLRAITQAKLPDLTGCMEPKQIEQPFNRLMIWEWGKHATPGYETAPVALEVSAGIFGIRTFVMVGFDGYDDHRDDYAPSLGLPRRNGDGHYEVVNRHLDEVAAKRKLRLVWWHRAGSAHHLEGQQTLLRRPVPNNS